MHFASHGHKESWAFHCQSIRYSRRWHHTKRECCTRQHSYDLLYWRWSVRLSCSMSYKPSLTHFLLLRQNALLGLLKSERFASSRSTIIYCMLQVLSLSFIMGIPHTFDSDKRKKLRRCYKRICSARQVITQGSPLRKERGSKRCSWRINCRHACSIQKDPYTYR